MKEAAERVVLVDSAGAPVGTERVRVAHGVLTPMHLAVHSFLFDDSGRLLLSRRGLSRTAWPGVWSNSSEGHRRPGETAGQAAMRLCIRDLGVAPSYVRGVVKDFRYRARDATGLVENELCTIVMGRIDADAVVPDPEWIAETTWIEWADVQAVVGTAPALVSPWLPAEIDALAEVPKPVSVHRSATSRRAHAQARRRTA